ncbi:hypothetical protein LTR10_023362 [Elasticomyces elasticus]|uniref:PRISE-like Rossmann-fold domain-containing protein n=1 Tax=Exophiala sideris TaxID=1016849 RepID=A0ABR0IV91_9EURO|nr:hypothetical protein LTR10_023362 [Elasticomyces elasticus]KAK5023155.1 hypothetical protein LTR13_011299 [Exophiala sideris]KAK5023377.1 hypothetical protein LTS07_009252 [Exophiala sideris]KAK5048739.1 hypothetical protein LTR69_011330 [Exophiala sideris]KAK5176141.1 hypothetical protein LTR44_011320 [Eurotiomycetes sp. CCFEE 6388]
MPPSCKKVTHAFYASYVHTDDFTKLRDYNVPLFEHFLTAIDTVAGENLQRICLQTGGKHYGPHLGPVVAPMTEDLPRYADDGVNFYYSQEDFMFNLQKHRKWSQHHSPKWHRRSHPWQYVSGYPNIADFDQP